MPPLPHALGQVLISKHERSGSATDIWNSAGLSDKRYGTTAITDEAEWIQLEQTPQRWEITSEE
jgi:hypothetical protein